MQVTGDLLYFLEIPMAVDRKRSSRYVAVKKRVRRNGKSFMTTVYKLRPGARKKKK